MKKLILMLALAMPLFAFAQKTTPTVVAHVSAQEILALMPELKSVETALDSMQTNYENMLVTMQEEYNKKIVDLQQQASTLSQNVLAFRQQEIKDMEQRMQAFYQSIQQELQAKQVELMQPIQKRLLDAINKVAAAKGCTYVMEKSALIYTAPTAIDLTPAVKAELGIK
jgi:outer membrane protein